MFVGKLPLTAVDFVVVKGGDKRRVVKLRSSEHGLLVVDVGRDPLRPPATQLGEDVPRLDVEVEAWGKDYPEVKKFLWRKLKWELGKGVAKLFREFLDPKGGKGIEELARYHVDVEVTPRGSVHATLYVLDELAREVLESLLQGAEEKSYGMRKLFDPNVSEEEVEKELRFYLKRSNILLPEVLERFAKRLTKQGADPEEVAEGLVKVARVLRRLRGRGIETAVARAIAPHVEKVARSFRRGRYS